MKSVFPKPPKASSQSEFDRLLAGWMHAVKKPHMVWLGHACPLPEAKVLPIATLPCTTKTEAAEIEHYLDALDVAVSREGAPDHLLLVPSAALADPSVRLSWYRKTFMFPMLGVDAIEIAYRPLTPSSNPSKGR